MIDSISLLDLVTDKGRQNQDYLGGIIEWFDSVDRIYAQAAIKETNEYGETPLHILLRRNNDDTVKEEGGGDIREEKTTLLDVVKRFVEIDSDDDQQFMERRSSINSLSTIQLISNNHTQAYAIQDSKGYLPLHVACEDRRCSFEVICKYTVHICSIYLIFLSGGVIFVFYFEYALYQYMHHLVCYAVNISFTSIFCMFCFIYQPASYMHTQKALV